MNTKSKNNTIDYWLLATVIILSVVGIIMLSSASVVFSADKYGDQYYLIKRQLVFGFIPGFCLLFAFAKINYKVWERFAPIFYVLSIISLIMVFIPGLSVWHGGARRWINLGFSTVQPAEFVKLAFVIFLSYWLVKKGNQIKNFSYGFLPYLVILGTIIFLIVLEPDIGTLSVIAVSSLAMVFSAGARMEHIFTLITASLIGFWGLVKVKPYRLNRIIVFWDSTVDPRGIGYQIQQALIAIGSGGWFGLGLGKSRQKYRYLPEVTSDSIFAVISEELGFILTAFIIVVFLFLIYRAIKIARGAPDAFAKYLCLGIIVWVGYQTLLNIGSMLKLVPLTGLPLPFISFGSSALWVIMMAMGILLNISKYSKR